MRSSKVYILAALGMAFILAPVAGHAQNFADFTPSEQPAAPGQSSEEESGTLTDEQVVQILEAEGVPLRNVKEQGVDDVHFVGESKYTLGVLDVIAINVQRHPEVSGQFSLNAEGKIQYEFVGDVYIEGKTKQEVKEILTEELSKYIIAPEVTITIVGYNSKVVYVIGEVGSPGKIYMRGDTITVREALVQAGLPLLSAKMGDGRVVTPSAVEKPGLKKVNIHKLLLEGDLKENLVMKPGDTLYVPPTFWAKAMRVIQPVAAPIGTAAGTGRTVVTGF